MIEQDDVIKQLKNMTFAEKVSAAQDINTPVDMLAILAEGEWLLRITVASNPSAPVDILRRLSRDLDSEVRFRACHSLRLRWFYIEKTYSKTEND